MEDGGLDPTLANRERAEMGLFRAGPGALLNVAERWPMIDRRKNALGAGTLPGYERAELVFPASVDVCAAPTDAGDPTYPERNNTFIVEGMGSERSPNAGADDPRQGSTDQSTVTCG